MGETTPVTLADIDAAWLTGALAQAGSISGDATIDALEQERLGEGEGFMGEIARLRLTYGSGTGPASVVAKVPTSDPGNRATGRSLGIYEREVRAYDTLLASVDVPVPRSHVAIYEARGDEADFLADMIKAERLPLWLLRRLVRREQTDADVPPCILVLDDLDDLSMGDQVAGCDPDRAAAALTVAARMHASTWGDRCPEERHWFVNGDVVPRLFHAIYLDNRKSFERQVTSVFRPAVFELARSVRKTGLARIRELHERAPRCLLHADFRLDNLFFDRNGDVASVIDWQSVNRGPAVLDVAYFLTGSIDPATPESVVDDLLAHYHAGLVDAGVGDYDLARLRADYDEALLLLLHRMSGLDSLELGDDRGQQLIETWLRRVDARMVRIV
ncbi:MAG: phosphotransferase [Actinomycetota bacterium]